jgi:hypothetical protein
MLTDSNGVTLGTVLSVGTTIAGAGYTPAHFAFVTIRTSTGHIVAMGLDGLVVYGQVYWNGGNCNSGSGILNTGSSTASRKGFCKLVVRGRDGTLYTTGASGCDSSGLVDSVQLGGITHIDSTGVCSASESTNFGWPVTATNNASVGLPATIGLPLTY